MIRADRNSQMSPRCSLKTTQDRSTHVPSHLDNSTFSQVCISTRSTCFKVFYVFLHWKGFLTFVFLQQK